MRFVAIADDGTEIELKDVQGLDKEADVVIMKMLIVMKSEEITRTERYFHEKLRKTVVLLPPWIDEVMTL